MCGHPSCTPPRPRRGTIRRPRPTDRATDELHALTVVSARRRAPDQARTSLVDELSARELDALRLLRSDLSGPAIARELLMALNTERTDTKTIYLSSA